MRLGFPARMAWRETRGAWRHFLGLFACVALGVAALTAVDTLAGNVDRALTREARSLMGGDLELRSARPLQADGRAAVERLRAGGASVIDVRELVGMARDPVGGGTLLVELKAVDAGYPLYGQLRTAPAGSTGTLLAAGGVLVHEEVLRRLGLGVGDPLLIGAAPATIRAVIVKEPDAPAGLGLGPRVIVGDDTLRASGLVQPGSRVRHRTLVRLPEDRVARDVRDDVARSLTDPVVRVTAFNEGQPGVRRFFTQMTTYLGLIGLVSLLVGGIGVASTVATFVRRQRPTIAILKSLGARSGVLIATYVVQTQAIALAAALVGVGLGVVVQPLVTSLLSGVFPVALGWQPRPATLLRGVAMGTLTSLLWALWPLLSIQAVPPSLILRREVEPARVRPSRRALAALPVAGGLGALVLWQAGSMKVGAIFGGASLAALALLAGLARLLVWSTRARPRAGGLAWRQGVANLARPGGQTAAVVVAVGVGVMLLVSVAVLEGSVGRQIDQEQRREAPSFFFIDIQPDQREAFDRLLRQTANGTAPVLTPVVRSRLAAINGQAVTRAMVEHRLASRDATAGDSGDGEEGWYLRREYMLTFATEPPPGNVVVKGRWWVPGNAGRALISLEESAARRLHVGVGDRLTFDVQGIPVEGEVTSIRKVDWQSLSTNFFVIFSPGALDGAPATWVATARVPVAAEAALQGAVVRAFPNVTAVAVRDVLERVSDILGRMALAVRLMAAFSIGAGLVVMTGALMATRYARLRESVIWRTLGATRGVVARIFAVEYACLGAVAGLGGTALALVLSWVVLRFLLDVPWAPAPQAVVLGVVATVALSLAVGFLGTWRLLGQKPLAVLREP